MKNRYFITGGSGKTGQALLEIMTGRGVAGKEGITCLLRPGGRRDMLERFPVDIAEGDASVAGSVERAYRGEDTVIHISSIFHTGAVLDGCAGMKRIITISSTGVFSHHRSTAGRIAAEEERVEKSGIPFVIIRPTMIYGTPHDRNISRLIRLVNRFRVIPLPSMSSGRFQPVHVAGLAGCIYSAATGPGISGSYNIPGGSAHTLEEMIGIISDELGKKTIIIPVPFFLVRAAVGILGALRSGSPVDEEQILRLGEDKTFDYSRAARELGHRPRSFREGIREQAALMGMSKKQL